jgi:hypothetical protein
LGDHPLKDIAEIEITCQRCGYRMMRTAAQLRRKAGVICLLRTNRVISGNAFWPTTGPTK